MPIYPTQKHNLFGTAAPGASDDRASDYVEGSRWIDVLTGTEYVCIDATRGAARWMVNQYAGIDSVAGLRQALLGIQSPTRLSLIERFEKRPFVASDVTILTDNSGGTVGNTLAEVTTGGSAADETPTQNAIASLAAKINNALRANADWEVAGTNMTSALVTQNAGRGGIRLTSAGANNDQCILQPRRTNTGDSRWALGFTTDLLPVWSTSFRLTSVAAISVKAGLTLTNAHNLTTDDDQVALWFSTATGGNFLAATSIGGTDATIDTGVTPAASTEYRLEISLEASRKALFKINGVEVARTGALTTAKDLIPVLSIQALTGAAKVVDVRYMAAAMNQAA